MVRVLLPLVLVGCVLRFDPGQALIACESKADCPGQRECHPTLHRCVDTAAGLSEAPEVTALSVTPSVGKAGSEITVSFDVSHALAIAPVVTFGGANDTRILTHSGTFDSTWAASVHLRPTPLASVRRRR